MTWDAKNPVVPWGTHGMDHYPAWNNAQWKQLPPFYDILELKSMARGRSAAYFWWENESGILFPMFMTDMLTVIQNTVLHFGKTEMVEWKACKRGQNYGIQLNG